MQENCKHETSTVVVSYGQGYADRTCGIEVSELRVCSVCGKNWREVHRGNYVRVTPVMKIS